MNQRTDDVTALQSQNTLKTSRDITRATNEDKGLKALLVASNDSSFLLTLTRHARKNRDKWYVCLTRRPNIS